MKKILIIIVLIILWCGFFSMLCMLLPPNKSTNEKTNDDIFSETTDSVCKPFDYAIQKSSHGWKHGYRFDFQDNGHSYICWYTKCKGSYYTSIVHNPDCKCYLKQSTENE